MKWHPRFFQKVFARTLLNIKLEDLLKPPIWAKNTAGLKTVTLHRIIYIVFFFNMVKTKRFNRKVDMVLQRKKSLLHTYTHTHKSVILRLIKLV